MSSALDKLTILHSELLSHAIDSHNQYLVHECGGVALLPAQLQRYTELHIIAGWRIPVQIEEAQFELDILLDTEFPFSAPRIALTTDEYLLQWPHVEDNGILCLRDGSDSINHSVSTELSKHYIEEAKKLISANRKGLRREDFIQEFESYWVYFSEKNGSTASKLFLLKQNFKRHTSTLYFTTFKNITVLCDSASDGARWIEEYFKEKSFDPAQFNPTAIFWLKAPLYPDEYPKANADVKKLVIKNNPADKKYLDKLVPIIPSPTPLVLAFDTPNGIALAGVWLNEPIVKQKGKNRYPRFNGFRQGSTISPPPERYYEGNTRIETTRVQRIDRKWLFERTSGLDTARFDNYRVCIIGCGSLGAGITKILAQSGIANFVLIDDEPLGWDNVGRHLLGGSYVGRNKASAVEEYLKDHFPGNIVFDSHPKPFQEVFSTEPDIFYESDIIISTVGDGDTENALNYIFNTDSKMPPLLFGWLEPFGIVGHALLTAEIGGCFSCFMNSQPGVSNAVTQWEKDILTRMPACGVSFQPYGVSDTIPTQRLIARLCIEALTNKDRISQHHTWIGDISKLEMYGGKLNTNTKEYYGALDNDEFVVKRKFTKSAYCPYNH